MSDSNYLYSNVFSNLLQILGTDETDHSINSYDIILRYNFDSREEAIQKIRKIISAIKKGMKSARQPLRFGDILFDYLRIYSTSPVAFTASRRMSLESLLNYLERYLDFLMYRPNSLEKMVEIVNDYSEYSNPNQNNEQISNIENVLENELTSISIVFGSRSNTQLKRQDKKLEANIKSVLGDITEEDEEYNLRPRKRYIKYGKGLDYDNILKNINLYEAYGGEQTYADNLRVLINKLKRARQNVANTYFR